MHDTTRRRFAATLALPMAAALLAGSPLSASAEPAALQFSGQLRDLDTAHTGAFDGARARVLLVRNAAGATAHLRVEGIDLQAAGATFGAHLHFGPCVAGNGAAALGHYNSDVVAGRSPVEISPETEVWLDFTVTPTGKGSSTAVVPFTPTPGARSVVIHALATDHHTGGAGARLACLPVVW